MLLDILHAFSYHYPRNHGSMVFINICCAFCTPLPWRLPQPGGMLFVSTCSSSVVPSCLFYSVEIFYSSVIPQQPQPPEAGRGSRRGATVYIYMYIYVQYMYVYTFLYIYRVMQDVLSSTELWVRPFFSERSNRKGSFPEVETCCGSAHAKDIDCDFQHPLMHVY